MQKDDVIYRQVAIDAVEESRRLNHHQNATAALTHEHEHRHFLKMLMDLPSAQSEQHWILVSERLPEEPNMYTVTDSNGNVVRFPLYNNKASREYWRRCVKAWMPSPDPYEE